MILKKKYRFTEMDFEQLLKVSREILFCNLLHIEIILQRRHSVIIESEFSTDLPVGFSIWSAKHQFLFDMMKKEIVIIYSV